MSDLANRGPLGPRKPKHERGMAAGLRHMARVKEMACVACGKSGPSDAHHCFCGRYGSAKASDFDTIPLCKDCHQGPNGIHAAKASWVARHGPDYDFLPIVRARIERE